MADKLRITTEQLARDIAAFNENINNVLKAVEQLRNESARLNSMWDGPSHQAFTEQFNGDLEAANDLITELRNYASALEAAKKKYEDCVGRVDLYINAIRIE